jgi:hypothetical protein
LGSGDSASALLPALRNRIRIDRHSHVNMIEVRKLKLQAI